MSSTGYKRQAKAYCRSTESATWPSWDSLAVHLGNLERFSVSGENAITSMAWKKNKLIHTKICHREHVFQGQNVLLFTTHGQPPYGLIGTSTNKVMPFSSSDGRYL